jgi:hypothetical protein
LPPDFLSRSCRGGSIAGVRNRTFDLIENKILLAENADLVVIEQLNQSCEGQPDVPRIGFDVDLYEERGRDTSGTVRDAAPDDGQRKG